jgi:hypothetical protein
MSTSAFALGARFRRLPRVATNRRAAVWQTLAGLLVAAVTGAAVVYAVHNPTLKAVGASLVGIASAWFLTTRNPQLALALILLYLGLLDGYLKLASGSSAVTFVRDVFLFSLAGGLLVRAVVSRQRLRLPPLSGWLMAFTVIVLVELANPDAGTLEHSIAGLRQHLEFVPLFFLTFAFVRTTRALRTFCILLAVIAAANGVAGWVQFKETPAQFAAWGPGYAQRVLGTGSFAGAGRTGVNNAGTSITRPFGLGSDAGDGGIFGMLALSGVLALAAFSKRRSYQLFAVAMALLVVVAIVTSEGRSVIVGSGITLLAFGALALTARNRLVSLPGLAIVAAVIGLTIAAVVGAAGSGGFRYTNLGPSGLVSTTSTARGSSIAKIPHNIVTYPFGAGLGTAGPASAAPGASNLTQLGNIDTETEFSFLVVETGIPGMLAITGFLVMLLYLAFSRVRKEPDGEARILLAALTAPLVAIAAQFFVSAVTPSVPIGPYLFALGGIVSYWLMELPASRARDRASHAALAVVV